ncbi:M36 family metallopeptidase [Hymenobacter siberiensis]|uniref:M36 family metallopeptidase n=1 Tax=Hymenobacter siberiensis TaxID=2848396 RepID=UPI001C1E4BCE|nr:M36 family metallopeptidase [Hymenobacter siberiensis]
MSKPFTFQKLSLALLGLLPLSALHAQSIPSQQAMEKVLAVRSQWAGPGFAPADLRLSSAYADANGLEHMYVQQLYQGIPVFNKVQSLAFMGGRLASHAGAFVPAKQLAAVPATPAITATVAVSRALQHLDQPFAATPMRLTEANGPEARQTFAASGVARHDIVASLTWAFDEAGKPHLTWNVNIDLLGSPDWWNVRIDAATGTFVSQDNWTVSEAAAHRAQPAATAAKGTMSAAAQFLPPPPPPTTTASSYLVVPFPRERPAATGLQTETDPWLKAGATNNATTHGWNFDGTTNYAFTRGNNVAAYDDAANVNAPGNYANSQTAAPSLSFNYTPDFTTTPGGAINRNAAVVNLFYWNNIIHDITYQYGFTEAAGNFQADNLGRGGSGNDYVKAEAQDGAGTNNANFSTPADGSSGRMQMYLWTAPAQAYALTVTAPSTLAGSYTAVEGGFSTANGLATLGPISGQLALYGDAGNLGCVAATGTALTGKIALIYRGTCSFAPKVKNAQLAGAIAAIVVNNVANAPTVMGGTDNTVTIPSVMISQADGAALAAQIANNVQVTLPRAPAPNPMLDGDLDNGIVVHEYGHGVSTRLTGGPSNSSCLNNAEQGSEGWSDYLALMMTTDWATAALADGPNARPVGTYASGQAATARGIRRYPYSTSLTVNPLTYANVATNPEVHAIGEIWCAVLWDMTWNVIQQRGRIEPNLYNGAANGGNNVAMQLVMQGLKLQPCQPGFLDSRDAILAADSLLYQGQYHCTIWNAFARRGMGYSAVQGSSGSATDQTAAFDMPPPVTLQKVTPLVSGNTFSNEYKLTCNCSLPTAPYTLTTELPTGMQFVSSTTGGTLIGNKVTFSNLNFTALGQTRTLRFQSQATTAGACAPVTPVNDNREANTAGGFAATPITGTATWATSTAHANSGTTSWWATAPATPTDFVLTSAPFTPTGLSVLSIYHYFDFEGSYDGGTVEISTNNGTTWQNPATLWLQNGYNSTFDASTTAPGQKCFSGRSVTGTAGFIRSALDLRSFAGMPMLVRFRTRTDDGSPGTFEGWFIDDIQVINGCGGNQIVELRNGANTLQSTQTVTTYLLPAAVTAQKAGLAQASEFTAQPNPFGSQGLQLRLNLPSAQPQMELTLYDVAGRQLLHRTVERVAAGTSNLTWNEAASLRAGLYLVRLQLPDGSSTMLRVERE